METKKNVYEIVTERVINALESGVAPWHRPWVDDHGNLALAKSYTSGRPYGFINQLLLPAGEYITFRKAMEAGAKLKKGSKQQVVYENFRGSMKVTDDETGEETTKEYWSFRYYPVYNVNDFEGLPAKHQEPVAELTDPDTDEIMHATDRLIQDYMTQEHIEFHQGSNDAYYSPGRDCICVPALKQYSNAAEYYSTTLHEMVHSTGAEKRLSRKGVVTSDGFGGKVYSQEELVAEMGSAMLMAKQGIDSQGAFDNSVAYLQGWISKLKSDKKLIVIASQQAEKAAEYILNRKAV